MTFRNRKELESEKSNADENFDEELTDRIDFSNLPLMDLSDVPEEFKILTDHFKALRDKYNNKNK